jgi:hypothetical protein
MPITVMKLCTMPEAELKKMTKTELITSIKHESFYPEHYRKEAEKLQKQIEENATNERAACVMLAALVGLTLERNEYSGKIESNKLNILELVGLVAGMLAKK